MMDRQKQTQPSAKGLSSPKTYGELVEFLNTHWSAKRTDKKLTAIKQLDKALGNPSKSVNAILVAGSNGKSVTVNFATQLLQQEGLTVGAFYAPHILTYNERFSVNGQIIANKQFTEMANHVISTAQIHNISVDSHDILTAMALVYFKQHKVDVGFFEVATNSSTDPVNVCTPKIVAITRITDEQINEDDLDVTGWIDRLAELVKPGTYVASADQSKLNLQVVHKKIEEHGGIWGMPIRKLAPLAYPFEQLHGRCAALAERICQMYSEHFVNNNTFVAATSLLRKETGRRGRPTLEAKRQAELNPKKTIEQFWNQTSTTLPGRFQLLTKEKPTILLDTASNIDALKNLFLGIRLLHYQRPLKGVTFIMGCDKDRMHVENFLKALRYFAKKTATTVILCPLKNSVPGVNETSWELEDIANNIKNVKVKVRTATSFDQAFELAKKSVDERHGLIVVTGSKAIVTDYWAHKDIKRL